MDRYTVTKEAAILIKQWITAGRGVAIWNRIDFSGRGDLLTPARAEGTTTPMPKPHWSVSNEPSKVFESLTDFTVSIDKEVKRFHVGTRMGAQGFMVKVTDAGTRRIRAAVEAAGEGAYYVFDYEDEKNAVIMAPDVTMPLEEFNS